MSDPFVAEIKILGCNFAPKGHAMCNGQIMPISQNVALFSLLGTTYGGNGQSTFALPNLQGAVPVQQGQGPGLQLWDLGEGLGADSITLLQSEIPAHSHPVNAKSTAAGGTPTAANNVPALGAWVAGAQFGVIQQYSVNAPNAQMAPTQLAPAGGSLPHNNLMPYLALTYVIALQGVFPPRP